MVRVRALSAREVEAIKKPGVHWVAPSLYLQVRDDGTRSWLLRYMRNGKTHWHGLGPVRDVTLQEARDRAEELRVAIRRHGAHPVPGPRMKMKKPHAVPLASQTVDILRALRPANAKPDDLIFPGQKRGSAITDTAV